MALLEDFYYGNLIPNLLIPPDDKKLWKAASETEQKLREHLSVFQSSGYGKRKFSHWLSLWNADDDGSSQRFV